MNPSHSAHSPHSPVFDDLTQDEKNMGILCHVGPILLALLSGGGLGWAVPLVIYLVKRDESAYVEDQAVESLNFHITLALACVLAGFSMLTIILIPVALLFFLCVGLIGLILGVLAGIDASNGRAHRYPMTLRLVRASGAASTVDA